MEKGNTGTGTSSRSALLKSTGLRTGGTITRKNSQRREFLFIFSEGKLLGPLRLQVILPGGPPGTIVDNTRTNAVSPNEVLFSYWDYRIDISIETRPNGYCFIPFISS